MHTRALEGIVVLDLTTALAGPYATMLLAGLGATVIKVENPRHGGDAARNNAPYLTQDGLSLHRTSVNDMSISHLARSRGKKSITLDLKQPDGLAVFKRLVAKTDILVENYSAGVTRRLGIDHTSMREVNPAIIYTSISGFGSDGGEGRAMDTIVQALSGLMATAGEPDGPPVRFGLPVADLSAPLCAVIGTLAALQKRHRTGEGEHVDVSMLGALTSLVATEPYDATAALGLPTRTGQFVPRLAPFGLFECSDGWIALCGPTDKFAHALLGSIGGEELQGDPRFRGRDDRVRHASELHGLINSWTMEQPTSQVVSTLTEAGVPVAPVRDPMEAVRDERVLRRGEVTRLGLPGQEPADVFGPGMPFVLSSSDTEIDEVAPELGQHNRQILSEIAGLDDAMILSLERNGVI